MKKLILLAAFAISTGIASAQVSFGFQAGPNFGMSKLKLNDAYFYTSAHSQKNKMKIGFVAGVVAEIPITGQLAFRPELNFVQEGTKYSNIDNDVFGTYYETNKITLNYIQVPLNVIYHMPVGMGSVFFGLGPVAEIGLSGKNKYHYNSTVDPDFNKDYKIKFDGKSIDDLNNGNGDGNSHLKRFDVGLNVIAGYKLAMGVFAKIGYSHGLMDISPDKKADNDYDRNSFKNSSFNLTIGYMLGGSSKATKK